MITITSDTASPPGGWKLTVAETGHRVTAPYANSLRNRVNAHRDANGLPPMEKEDFEDAACRESGHGEPWCGGVKNPRTPTTMDAVRRFLKTMLVLAKKREFVSKEEHERRMAVCASCPAVSQEGLGCHGCIAELNAVEKEVGKMPPGTVLICSKCQCVCWAKSWLTNATMDEAEASDPPKYVEGHCWRLADSLEQRP